MESPQPGRSPVAVIDFNVNVVGPVGSHWAQIDELQRSLAFFWTTYAHGHWVLTDPTHIREAFQNPRVFSSISEVAAEPDPSYTWIPTNIDPPEHIKYRQILNGRFSPSAIQALVPDVASFGRDLVTGLAPLGRCDFMADFASVYPATVFLHSLGLPVEHAPQLVAWVRAIFDNLRHPDLASSLASAMGEVRAYFDDALRRRRRAAGHPDRDFLTHLLRSEIDGRPLREEEILNMCVVLTMAGVETTASQLGYMFHYLAEHPEKRRRIIEEPEVITAAVEEFLRVHPIVLPGRKVTRDIDFHGCPMRRGDMVMLPLPAANRCPATDEHPTEVDFDRQPNRHIAFGLGPHRCLGIHLARRELATALQVWHEIIPDYHLDGGQPLLERGGQLGLMTLPLAWDRPRRYPPQS